MTEDTRARFVITLDVNRTTAGAIASIACYGVDDLPAEVLQILHNVTAPEDTR